MNVIEKDGNIRLVLKDWPIFGPSSMRASQLTLGAEGLGLYAAAHAALMAMPGRLTEAQIDTALSEAGLDVAALDTSYRSERDKWDALILRNDFQAVQIGLQGTPAYIIGETIYAGAMKRAELLEAIAKSRQKTP